MSIVENLNGFVLNTFSVKEVKNSFLRNELVLIDVRTPQEYALEHILGAMLFPLSSFDPRKLPRQEGKPIVFYCRSGKRSRTVAEKCGHAGISKIAHMEGGFNAWKAADYPHVAIDTETGGYVRKCDVDDNPRSDNGPSLPSPLGQDKTLIRDKNLLNRYFKTYKGTRKRCTPQTLGEIASLNSSLL